METVAKSPAAHKWDTSAAHVASITAQLAKTKSFRTYLKSEVLKAFDGDYNVLLSNVVKYLKDATRLSRLTDYSAEQIAYLEMIAADYPQMQIAVQTDPNDWNTVTYIPPTTYLSSDYDESTTQYVPVVDANGNIIGQLDAQNDPPYPVIIVSENERTAISPSGEVVLTQTDYAYQGISYQELQPDSLTPISPNQPLQWYSENYKYESIYALTYEDIGKIEGWPAGGPETRIYTYNTDNPQGTSYKSDGWYHGEKWAKRKDVKNAWFVFESTPITCHLWRWDQTGTTIKFAFYEYDYEPFGQQHADSLANLVTQIANNNNTGAIIASGIRLIGLFLPKAGQLSEFIGELEVSANNNAVEFRKGSGGFGWRSKPF